jgi:hypothetical protein
MSDIITGTACWICWNKLAPDETGMCAACIAEADKAIHGKPLPQYDTPEADEDDRRTTEDLRQSMHCQ